MTNIANNTSNNTKIFSRADILIPAAGADFSKWSVIACDQHTSEPEYWRELEEYVGDAPSTLRLMLPEAYLGRVDPAVEAGTINKTMRTYLDTGIFQTLSDSYVYLERTLPGGIVRRGIIGAIDLDAYDYTPGSRSPIRATEGTVEDRLPPRVKVRKDAPLEMPHVMVFVNDPDGMVFDTCASVAYGTGSFSSASESRKIYDFELNSRGGHLRGWQIAGREADRVDSAFDRLFSTAAGDLLLAIGDGNHSLAAAKKCGDRYALVELVNIHDPSIVFEPIHRVVFNTDPEEFAARFSANKDIHVYNVENKAFLKNSVIRECSSHLLRLTQNDLSYGELVCEAEMFCQDYVAAHGGRIDYIHNDSTAIEMGSRDGCFAVLLPVLDKTTLFESVAHNGPYPKKSFSIGHADEKRFYLECRRR